MTFRSYKTIREDLFVQDVRRAPLHVANAFDDVND